MNRKIQAKKNVLDFNHIDKGLTKERKQELANLYLYDHKQFWTHKAAHQYFKKMDLALKLSSAFLVSGGTIAGIASLNPIVLGTISGSSMLLAAYTEAKNHKRKIELTRFPYTSYEKILVGIRAFLRGDEYNHDDYINELKILEEIIVDLCPTIPDWFGEKYNKIFTA